MAETPASNAAHALLRALSDEMERRDITRKAAAEELEVSPQQDREGAKQGALDR